MVHVSFHCVPYISRWPKPLTNDLRPRPFYGHIPVLPTSPPPVLLTSSLFLVSLIILLHVWRASNSTYHVISKLLSGFKSPWTRTLLPCNVLRASSGWASLSISYSTVSLSVSTFFCLHNLLCLEPLPFWSLALGWAGGLSWFCSEYLLLPCCCYSFNLICLMLHSALMIWQRTL